MKNETVSLEDPEQIELDRRTVRKIRANATVFAELFDQGTEFIYDSPFRRRVEVEGGYKIARRRGARLDEVKVFNPPKQIKREMNNAKDILIETLKRKIKALENKNKELRE